ncbi:MAG: hypothetical protein Ta2F_03120 [Termitinemataceae bacterium]|nr:MAG: hypothetical protein Ta2F_03120 [Termitinemataceae bacterium]
MRGPNLKGNLSVEVGNWNPAALSNSVLNNSAAIEIASKQNLKNSNTKSGVNQRHLAGVHQSKSRKSSAFSKLLNRKLTEETNIAETKQALENLLDDVHSCGEDLIKYPYPNQIVQYRESIKKFINYVVDNVYTVEKEKGIMNMQKPQYKDVKDPEVRRKLNVYSSIKIIDQKLDNLAASIIMSQAPQIKLLASIEEINGLVVDLLR